MSLQGTRQEANMLCAQPTQGSDSAPLYAASAHCSKPTDRDTHQAPTHLFVQQQSQPVSKLLLLLQQLLPAWQCLQLLSTAAAASPATNAQATTGRAVPCAGGVAALCAVVCAEIRAGLHAVLALKGCHLTVEIVPLAVYDTQKVIVHACAACNQLFLLL